MAFKREKRSSSWRNEQGGTGRSKLVRECGNSRAEIVEGESGYTVNIYDGGKHRTRRSSRTVRGIKALASRQMRCSVKK